MLDAHDEIEAKMIKEIMRSTRSAFVGQFIVLAFCIIALHGYAPAPLLIGWSLGHSANFLYRWRLVERYLQLPEDAQNRADQVETLLRHYLFSLAITSALWAGLPFFMGYMPAEHHFLIYALVVTLTYGATMSIGPLTPVFVLYVLPMNLTLMAQLFRHGDPVYNAAALFLIVILFFSAKAARMYFFNYKALVRKENDAQVAKRFFEKKATHDALTGLPNRFRFFGHLEKALTRANKNGERVALFFIDLDHFKQINDTYGHQVGDKVIEIIGKRLAASVRDGDLPARLAGDEFVIVVEHAPDDASLARIAKKIHDALAAPMALQAACLHIRPSIGIARFPENGKAVGDIVKAADTAMYQSKRAKTPYCFADKVKEAHSA
jgi:diguanylate cyclase (GGDEF)-like protein